MAKLEQIHRLLYIAELLKSKPNGITYEETKGFLEEKFQEKGFELKFSEKTFKRDRNLIAEILGLESKYKKDLRTFYLSNEELDEDSNNTLEDVLLIEAFRKSKKNSKIIIFEKREPKGLYHFTDFVDAIKRHRVISFVYQKFYEKEPEKRVVVPYALKESQNRWYLLATDFSVENKKSVEDFLSSDEKMKIKSFGLDRISNVEIHHTRQLRFDDILEDSFKNSFGVSSTVDQTPQEIVLSFTPHQGQYIKSLPLHHSQEILIDNEKELRIKVTLYPTFDFTQKILSHGHNVTVISPESFQNELKLEIQKMLNNYSEKA
ncbi:WYL domain-containing protein [Kaistella haifensis DSM 19056]|uniref:WYL domain-containing protein n=1 Tax=Kaistella haifensis DSM 19056 TaxID=1450526 RepID=A0A246B6L4_9FLAO|nr:WYL domain-containing protein [Kaistella haifensis]OWK97014.1 WYL domain-containing protein [Kaistella haifensis DSM 19056]